MTLINMKIPIKSIFHLGIYFEFIGLFHYLLLFEKYHLETVERENYIQISCFF